MGLSAPWRRGLSRATRHYRSLFALPGGPLIVLLRLAVGSLFGLSLRFQLDGLPYGVLWMTLPSLASDILTFYSALGDRILRLRRIMALTLFADFLWFCSASAGRLAALLGLGNRALVISYAMGFSAAASSRFMVLHAVSPMAIPRTLVLSLIHPSLCLVATWLMYPLGSQTLVYVVVSLPFMMASVAVLLSGVDSVARPALGYGSLELFRAFAANWMEDEAEPLERVFSRLAVPGEARLGLVSFSGADADSLVMVVPYVHAGPFKNVGSSLLTSLIQERLQRSADRPVAVFHGTAGHDKNVSSRPETERIVRAVGSGLDLRFEGLKATPMVRIEEGRAKVACQKLNNIALLAVTLAPSNMEDLPEEVGLTIAAYGKTLGFDAVFVIDAHNSLADREAVLDGEEVNAIITACRMALRAVKESPVLPTTIGASSLVPKGFSVEQGMGRGGITAGVITVPGQTAAYVCIDGNNMVSNLRERILNRLDSLGVTIGEVFTSDTHEVNATITGRGYHPIGEAMDNDVLIGLVEQSVREALADRKAGGMAWKEVIVENIGFLGPKNVDLFSAVTDVAITEARRAAVTVFPAAVAAALATLVALPL